MMHRGTGFVAAFFFLIGSPAVLSSEPGAAGVQVRIVTDEAAAALAILGEHHETGSVKPESWERLWKSEGFVRLKKRDESFGAKDVEESLRKYLTSEEAVARLAGLREAVAMWQQMDVTRAARRAASYLPGDLRLRATIYPVIKPKGNSFVFELNSDPAIFMYVEAKNEPAKLENTLAHELHHVGIAGCPKPPDVNQLPAAQQRAFRYLGGFNEGLAVLAAAGGPNVHPHASSEPEAWLVWERDIANFNSDLRRIESYFRDVLTGRLSAEEENRRLFLFINPGDVPQGGFYTVGWRMAAMIERARGREALVKLICDPRALLATYNEVASAHPRSDGEALPLWSAEFLKALSDKGSK
jgi:hypothetical protein